jgi:hypothetical protein
MARSASQWSRLETEARRRPLVMRGTWMLIWIAWQVIRLPCCAVLILMEPLLRVTLVPIAFLSFCVTLVFGFMIGDPKFPRWGMLAFSVGTLMVYWAYLGLMSFFMTLPPTHDR